MIRREFLQAAVEICVARAVGICLLSGCSSKTHVTRAVDSSADSRISIQLQIDRQTFSAERDRFPDDLEITSPPKPAQLDVDNMPASHFIDPISVIVAVTVAWLVARIVDDWLKSRENGVEIDTRTEPPTVSILTSVPRGFVVIIHKDGSVTTQKVDYDSSNEFAEVLSQALTSTQQ